MVARRSLIAGLSLGLVMGFILLFLFTQASLLFPGNSEAYRIQIGIYGVVLAVAIGFNTLSEKRTERPLFTTAFFSFKGIGKLLLFTIISVIILFIAGTVIGTQAIPKINQALQDVGIGVILLHIFVVGFVEELVFRGVFVNELKARRVGKNTILWTQAIIFAIFHVSIAGGELLLLIPYIPLGILFFQIKERFSPQTQTANIGAHAGWNLFILGFLR